MAQVLVATTLASCPGNLHAMATRSRSPRQDLLRLGHGSFMSASARESLLQEIRRGGIPDAVSRRSYFRQRASAIDDLQTPYGPVIREVQLPEGNPAVPVQSPLAMLYAACDMSAPFRQRMTDRTRACPSSQSNKWGIILYSDEISPQNPLAAGPDHRKVQAIYWTIRELGDDVKYVEQVWFTLAVTR